MHKIQFFILFFFLITAGVKAQVISFSPAQFTADDTITLTFRADEGNAALKDYAGDVYMHTGLITQQSTHQGDWKFVITNWNENTPENKLDRINANTYSKKFHIRTLYGVPETETILQLAFVFRNANGSIVGRSAENGDIFYSLTSSSGSLLYSGYSFINDTLKIFTEKADIRITAHHSNMLQIKSEIKDTIIEKRSTVLPSKQITPVYFSAEQNYLKFSTDSVLLVIDTSTLMFSFVYQNDTILKSAKIFSDKTVDFLKFQTDASEQLYGTGSRAIPLNRKGYTLDVYNQASYGYGYGAQNLNITLPAISSSKKYTLYIDNFSKGKWNLAKDIPTEYSYLYTHSEADVYFIVGDNHAALSQYFAELTGYQPLPPIWALGYIQSKYGYETESETRNIVTELQNNQYPIDAIVLDLYWFGNTNTMGNLNWDFSRFPNPEKMMSDLKGKGVKTILITETYFTQQSSNYAYAANNGFFAKNAQNQPWVIGDFWAGSASLLDIFNPDAQKWFWQFYHNRINEGAEGWWTDLGEPENHPADMVHYQQKKALEIHNIYALEWEKMLYENWQSHFPEKRLFNLTRSGYAGMQKYSTFPWSGDIQRSFDGLKAQVPIMLSMGLHGIGYMHSDIGGFTGGGQNDELFVRWVQMGIFSPVFRIHGTGIETHPTAYSAYTHAITRKYIQWRYDLLPYNYTLAYENATKGTPLARTMDFYEPENEYLQNINDQYFWGENLVVAPVLQAGITSRSVKIPVGKWINWHNTESYTGPTTKSISAPLSDIPVLVKAGSIIPLAHQLKSTDEYTSETLVLKYFRDETVNYSSFTMFDDDKKSAYSLLNNQFELLHFEANQDTGQIILKQSKSGHSYSTAPVNRNIVLEIPRTTLFPDSIFYMETRFNAVNSLAEVTENEGTYFLDLQSHTLHVNFIWNGETSELKISGFRTPSTSGISNFENFVKIYPNPANAFIIAEANLMKNISIINSYGKIIKYLTFNNLPESENVDVSDLPVGVYFMRIQTQHYTVNKKIIIQR